MTKLIGGIPLEENGGVPVNLQDQHSRMVAAPLHIDLNDGKLLAAPTAIDDLTVTLTAGHGAVIGNCLVIREGINWFFAGVLNVATNVLTLDTPLDYAYTTDADLSIGNCNLNANGAVTAVEAHVQPPLGAVWDITRLHVIISDDAAMDFTTFGGISPLTNGLVFGKGGGTAPQNIANIKTNGDLMLFSESFVYLDKVGGGEYSLTARYQFAGQDGVGVTMRLDSTILEHMRVLIQDNLSAISVIRMIAVGHVVED